MGQIAQKSIYFTTLTSVLMSRIATIAVPQFASICSSAIAVSVIPALTSTGTLKMLRTMISMMITMPSRGGR